MTGPTPSTLADAQGKFAAFMAAMLQRAGGPPAAEFAELLDAFAQTVAETDPEEGKLLAAWADAVRAAQPH
jgi:hypothetical protein